MFNYLNRKNNVYISIMCSLCQTNVLRTYSHSLNTLHRKKLFNAMRLKKQESIKKHGFFKYD